MVKIVNLKQDKHILTDKHHLLSLYISDVKIVFF